MQQENERYTQQIQGLKTDQKAIEKEAREQMGYAKPGEYVYVPPAPPKKFPAANRTAKKITPLFSTGATSQYVYAFALTISRSSLW